jgi:hypothetical protein
MGRTSDERAEVPRQDSDQRDRQPRSAHAAVAEIHEILARGTPDPQMIALVIQGDRAFRPRSCCHAFPVRFVEGPYFAGAWNVPPIAFLQCVSAPATVSGGVPVV